MNQAVTWSRIDARAELGTGLTDGEAQSYLDKYAGRLEAIRLNSPGVDCAPLQRRPAATPEAWSGCTRPARRSRIPGFGLGPGIFTDAVLEQCSVPRAVYQPGGRGEFDN